MSTLTDKLLTTCAAEWDFFGHSEIRIDGTTMVGKREYDDGAWQRVGDYWRFLGGPYKNLTGKDRGVPWSAAFVSWCMHEAGAGADFPYSAGHATYINAAIRNSGNAAARWQAHKPRDHTLKVGDLIGYWRGARAISVDNALAIGWYESHTDIVVEVVPGMARTIGGNVMHSVTRREVKLGSSGELTDRSENWFVVIENGM